MADLDDSAIAISVQDVSKTFKLPHERNSSIKGALINMTHHKKGYEEQHVLEDISFEIKKGEFFGIVGRNGSGKSTLLKLLAGIYMPDKGNIQINGKLTPFIELGVGFNPELTGRDNIFLNGALLGFNRREMSAMYADIVAFAELERFMDQKLKNYSSGMQVRLAFSIATRAKSDILLIDEVLAVGDAAFQNKCFDYFYELRRRGATVVFVSHDRGSLERFCDRGILIDKGLITERGSIRKVLKTYSNVVLEEMDHASEDVQKKASKRDTPQPTYAVIQHVATTGKEAKPKRRFVYGETVTIQFEVAVKEDLVNPILGVTVWEKNVEKAIYATNTLVEGVKETGKFSKGDTLLFRASLPRLLNDGEYYVEPAIANESAAVFYDQQPKAATFFINGSNNPHALLSSDNPIILSKI